MVLACSLGLISASFWVYVDSALLTSLTLELQHFILDQKNPKEGKRAKETLVDGGYSAL